MVAGIGLCADVAAALGLADAELVVSIAAELRVRYHLERVYQIPRAPRFLRSKGPSALPFPVPADLEVPAETDPDVLLPTPIDDQPTQPVDLPEGSSARAQFSSQILGKAVPAVSAYWQQQIFAGKELPPLTKASEAEIVAYVKANANAIGYVSTASVTHEVKVLALK